MDWNYILTFERQNDPPVTVRGTVQGTSFATAAQRSIKAARKESSRVRADSIALIIERNTED
jgi:hypothetical protein